jgi:hypothetical protein
MTRWVRALIASMIATALAGAAPAHAGTKIHADAGST